MTSRTIRADEHGVFVVTDGYLFRPADSFLAATGRAVPWGFGIVASSGFTDGDKVPARHVTGTPYAKVGPDDRHEFWQADTRSDSAKKHAPDSAGRRAS